MRFEAPRLSVSSLENYKYFSKGCEDFDDPIEILSTMVFDDLIRIDESIRQSVNCNKSLKFSNNESSSYDISIQQFHPEISKFDRSWRLQTGSSVLSNDIQFVYLSFLCYYALQLFSDLSRWKFKTPTFSRYWKMLLQCAKTLVLRIEWNFNFALNNLIRILTSIRYWEIAKSSKSIF